MIIILIAAVLGLVPAAIAAAKGRSFVLWWLYGTLLFIIALPHAIFAKSASAAIDAQKIGAGNKQCPSCAEWIRPEAKMCRFCGTKFAALVAAGLIMIASPFDVRPVRASEITLPISDPLPILALAHRLDSSSVIAVIRSCFTVPKCGRTPGTIDFTPNYDSVFTKIPSTRFISALRDCSRLEAVTNEFQMRDLDIETRAAMENAAPSVPARIVNINARAEAGTYDFARQGFPIKWQQPIKIYEGRKTCRGQQIIDAQNEFPTDFYVSVDPVLLPGFMPVPPEKARAWVESNKIISVVATFTIDVRKVHRGILRITGRGVPTGWVFSGASILTRFAWLTGNTVVDEVAMAAAPAMRAAPAMPASEILKVDRSRIIKSDVNVRAAPSKSAGLAAVLKPNQYVVVRAKSPDGLWSQVSVDATDIGWILDTAFLKNSMSEEEAAAISEGDMFDNVEPPKN